MSAITAPALPPHIADIRSKTTAQVLAELNESPLFMTDLVDNDATEALRALAYEGSPFEVAENFKEQGNDLYAVKKWADAKEYYGKGIDVLEGEQRKRRNTKTVVQPTEIDVSEAQKELKLLETLYVNRAACQLEVRNLRSCVLDCGKALALNDGNVKALYRGARALLALGKLGEALVLCERGLAIDGENQSLKSVLKELRTAIENMRQKQEKEIKVQQRNLLEQTTLRAALKARGIKTKKTAQPPEMEDARIQLLPDPVDPTSELVFPTVLLYPLHLESDFIKAFQETHSLQSHLEYILPTPWDRTGAYTLNNVEAYMETTSGGLIKVGKKVPLLQALSSGNIEIIDEVVRIFVLPKSMAKTWVEEFKKKRLAERGAV